MLIAFGFMYDRLIKVLYLLSPGALVHVQLARVALPRVWTLAEVARVGVHAGAAVTARPQLLTRVPPQLRLDGLQPRLEVPYVEVSTKLHEIFTVFPQKNEYCTCFNFPLYWIMDVGWTFPSVESKIYYKVIFH